MAAKETKLSIVLSTVDKSTAKLQAINARLDAITKPTRDFKKALSDLGEKSGLNAVAAGFKDVGHALGGVLAKMGILGGIAGAAAGGLYALTQKFDDLGDAADRVGVSVDFLAQLRYAALQAGAPVGALDQGLKTFSENVGRLKANTGRLATFLGKVSPALEHQVKAAKTNEQAFDLLARAMAKLHDPAKRSALAMAAFGDSSLAPLLSQGAKGIAKLRKEYFGLAGSQQDAADKGGAVDASMHKLHAALDGVEAALVSGMGPAITQIIGLMTKWFSGHRAAIAAWADKIGKKLPGALEKLANWLEKAFDKVESFVDAIGGIGNAAKLAAAVVAGPLILSVVKLGTSLLTAISRAGQLGKALAGIPGGAAGGAAGAAEGAEGAAVAVGAGASAVPLVGLTLLAAHSIESDKKAQARLHKTLNMVTRRAAQYQYGGTIDISSLPTPVESAGPSTVTQRDDVSTQARAAVGAAAGGALGGRQGHDGLVDALVTALSRVKSLAKVSVDFANVPRGARVKTDPQSTADVDMTAGYQMGL